MSHTLINPPALHNPVDYGYSHIARVPAGELVLIAGQYGADRTGELVSADFAVQVERAFDNLGAALAAVGLDFPQVAQLRTFIVDHDTDKLSVLVAEIRRRWGNQPPTQTLLGVASLALPGMLFEVDAVAVH